MESAEISSDKISHAFLFRPDVRFSSQHQEEDVVLVVRQHIFTQLSWIANGFIFISLLILGNFILPSFFSINQIVIVNFFVVSFVISYFWINILLWYFTVGVVTNERIIDLDFFNLIYKEFSATTIVQVSDITTKIGGFFGSLLNFGTVNIQTEGFEQNIEFERIPRPSTVVKIINNLMKLGGEEPK